MWVPTLSDVYKYLFLISFCCAFKKTGLKNKIQRLLKQFKWFKCLTEAALKCLQTCRLCFIIPVSRSLKTSNGAYIKLVRISHFIKTDWSLHITWQVRKIPWIIKGSVSHVPIPHAYATRLCIKYLRLSWGNANRIFFSVYLTYISHQRIPPRVVTM